MSNKAFQSNNELAFASYNFYSFSHDTYQEHFKKE